MVNAATATTMATDTHLSGSPRCPSCEQRQLYNKPPQPGQQQQYTTRQWSGGWWCKRASGQIKVWCSVLECPCRVVPRIDDGQQIVPTGVRGLLVGKD